MTFFRSKSALASSTPFIKLHFLLDHSISCMLILLLYRVAWALTVWTCKQVLSSFCYLPFWCEFPFAYAELSALSKRKCILCDLMNVGYFWWWLCYPGTVPAGGAGCTINIAPSSNNVGWCQEFALSSFMIYQFDCLRLVSFSSSTK